MKDKPKSKMGRPTIYDEPLYNVGVYLTGEMIHWLHSQPDGLTVTARRLIAEAMNAPDTEDKTT